MGDNEYYEEDSEDGQGDVEDQQYFNEDEPEEEPQAEEDRYPGSRPDGFFDHLNEFGITEPDNNVF